MSKTILVTVSNTAPTAIVAATRCQTIEIGEDASVAGWPTTDFLISRPTATDTQIRKPIGTTFIFGKQGNLWWGPGDVAGYVQSVAGPTTFFQSESP